MSARRFSWLWLELFLVRFSYSRFSTKLHFRLLHLLSVFFCPASTLQQFMFTEGQMLNGDAHEHKVCGAPLSLQIGDDET
jgi:hypothetical protein